MDRLFDATRALAACAALGLAACSGSAAPADAGADLAMPDLAPPFVPAMHAPYPRLNYGGGPLLVPLRIVDIVPSGDPIGARLLGFSDALAKSDWWSAFAAAYDLGTPTAPVHVTATPPSDTTLDDRKIVAYIDQLVQNGTAPMPDGATIYVFYMPAGASWANRDGVLNTNCMIEGGHHSRYHAQSDSYAVIDRCTSKDQAALIDQLTSVASHEIAEATTDPVSSSGYRLPRQPSHPWTQSAWLPFQLDNTECGDLCDGTSWREGGYLYQRVYANAAVDAGGDPCIPPLGTPYYDVSANMDWYPVSPGMPASIQLTGWSSGPTPGDWWLRADWYASDPSIQFVVSLSSPGNSIRKLGRTYWPINNGGNATVQVTAPPGTQSGAWLSITIFSLAPIGDPSPGWGGTDGDKYHTWMVGAYVP